MDIWLAAVLMAWLPIAAALALLIGRSATHAKARARRASALGRADQTGAASTSDPVLIPASAVMGVRQRVAS